MASLTESSLMFDAVNPEGPKKNNNNWIGSVYLCIQNSDISSKNIDGFKCFKFKNFIEADNYFYKNKYKILNDSIIYRYEMVPVCKWAPFRFHKFILNYKLNNIYWKNNITLMVKKE
jgi:hypothetical protein